MLSKPDRQVVQRDTELPGLALLLDTDRLRERLRHVWPRMRIEQIVCTYLRYKPGINCLAGYVARTQAGDVPIYAKARTRQGHSQGHRESRPTPRSQATGALVLDDDFVTLRRFPDDRKLRGLARLLSPAQRTSFLRKLVPEASEFRATAPLTLRYKPERRYVAQLSGPAGPRALIKLYDQFAFTNAQRGSRAFRTREFLVVAQRLGRSRRHCAIVSEWLAGDGLEGVLASPDFKPDQVRDVGSALAELHGQACAELERITPECQAVQTLTAAGAVAHLCPDLAPRVRDLALRVAAELLENPAGSTPIHGDFSADQVLLGTDGIGIIDLDRAGQGDPAADFGSCIARLESQSLASALPRGIVGVVAEHLVDGYCRQTRGSPPPGIDLHRAAALLRLAPHPFRERQAHWDERIEGIVVAAERALRSHSNPSRLGTSPPGARRSAS